MIFNYVDRENRRPSFSYLSLLPADGSFPHRTQPIGGPQTSRKTSTCNSSAGSRAPSAGKGPQSLPKAWNLCKRPASSGTGTSPKSFFF